ncbi:integrin alpha-M-like [Clarias gariepinus]
MKEDQHAELINKLTREIANLRLGLQDVCLRAEAGTCSTKFEAPDVDVNAIPPPYRDLAGAFCKRRATHLSPHRPYALAIELQPGSVPPRGHLYSLLATETQAMEEYVASALRNGTIRPSSSPAATGFFFVKKKGGELRPCVDYRGLNKITIKNRGVRSGLNVSLELKADAVRKDSRAFFNKDDKTSRSLVKSVLLNTEVSCYNHTVYMKSCVKDTVSPLLFRLNFSLFDHEPDSSNAILNIDSKTIALVEVPFQINCKNTTCISDLQLNFNFLNSTLLVVDQAPFIIHVTLLNTGDDSFNTSVVLFYPPGLSLSLFKTIKQNRRTRSSCGDRDEGALNKTTCSISLPVYRSNTEAMFEGVFRISRDYNWTDVMKMTLVASSDNNRNTSSTTVMKTLPVLYSVDVAVSSVPELSVTYLNFSLEDKGPKPIHIVFRVRNLGLKGLPVTISFRMPNHTDEKIFYLDDNTVLSNITACSIIPPQKHDEQFVNFTCRPFSLDPGSVVHITLSANVTFPNKQQYSGKWSFSGFKKEDDFSVFAQLDFDQKFYHQLSGHSENDSSRFHRANINVKAELVVPPDMAMIIGTGTGGGLLLLFVIILLLKLYCLYCCGHYNIKKATK